MIRFVVKLHADTIDPNTPKKTLLLHLAGNSYFDILFKLVWIDIVIYDLVHNVKKVSEYDQEIPQSQTADNPMALRGRAT